MTDRTYYKIMNWLGWTVIALGILDVAFYLMGLNPEFKWSMLELPLLATNLPFIVLLLREKDEIIEAQKEIIDTLRKNLKK